MRFARSANIFTAAFAQNCSICAKEEPQALKADKANTICLVAKSALRRRYGCTDSLPSASERVISAPSTLYFLSMKCVAVESTLS